MFLPCQRKSRHCFSQTVSFANDLNVKKKKPEWQASKEFSLGGPLLPNGLNKLQYQEENALLNRG